MLLLHSSSAVAFVAARTRIFVSSVRAVASAIADEVPADKLVVVAVEEDLELGHEWELEPEEDRLLRKRRRWSWQTFGVDCRDGEENGCEEKEKKKKPSHDALQSEAERGLKRGLI